VAIINRHYGKNSPLALVTNDTNEHEFQNRSFVKICAIRDKTLHG